jgi:peptidoglycan/LPS O-acetylase OafA/YrhL
VTRPHDEKRDDEAPGLSPDSGHLPELDGLRGIAIILVIVAHTISGSLGIRGPWYRLGELGVMVFFVLSGFLITGVLNTSERTRGRIDLREFYVRRALRIFPAAYALLAFCAVGMALGWITDVTRTTFFAAALYLRNIFGHGTSVDHLWSLSLEEQFYLVWPPVLVLAGCRKGLWVAAIATIAFTVFRTVAIGGQLWPYATGVFYERPWFRFDSLLIGCWFALLRLHSQTTWRNLAMRVRRLGNPLWTGAAAIAWTLFGEDLPLAHPFYLTVQMIFGALMFLQSLTASTIPLRKLLTSSSLRIVGRYSYSLYLWQQILLVTTEPSWGWFRKVPVNLALLMVAAYLSYRFVETPFLRLKDSEAVRGWLARQRTTVADRPHPLA